MHAPPNGVARQDGAARRPTADLPPPGQGPLLLAMLLIGFFLMAVQLWLLTVALDLLLAGMGPSVWQLALASGAIFLGGLLVLWLLRPRPRPQSAGAWGRLR